MGYKYEINWALKLKPEEGLESNFKEGKIYPFHKKESRIYPLGCNIDLINRDWEVLAQVMILEITITEKETRGIYKITRIYSDKEREILTRIAKKNAENLKDKGYVSK